jgi:hypothetical protein
MTWLELREAVADAERAHGLSFDDYELVLDADDRTVVIDEFGFIPGVRSLVLFP